MKLGLTDEQQALVESVQRFTERNYSFEQRRELLHGDADGMRRNWATFAELGWLAASLPEEVGGLGGAARDTLLILEGLGRALVLEPVLACGILPGKLLCEIGAVDLLPSLISGETIYAVAHGEPDARGRPGYVEATARREGNDYLFGGRKSIAIGAPWADRIILSARTSDSTVGAGDVSLFVLEPHAVTERICCYRLLDGRMAADIQLDGLRLHRRSLLGTEGGASAAINRAMDHAIMGACAEAFGAMDRALWLTRDYLKNRKQFGVPIGSFQALQHAMAEMLIEVEQSHSMVIRGAAALDADEVMRMKGVSASKAFISRSALRLGKAAVQLHGAIGLADECTMSHYFKKLFTFANSYGDPNVHYQRFSQL